MSFSFARHTAVFGGSFNPPHIGHIKAIEGLRKNPGVAQVLVAPSFGTPLKTVETPYPLRLQMAEKAFKGMATVSDLEGRANIQYTWELLEILNKEAKDTAFVIGTDQFKNLDRWSRFPEVLGMCDWIVLLRKPTTLSELAPSIQKLIQHDLLLATRDEREFIIKGGNRRLCLVDTDAPDVSSTQIRENYALGKKTENMNLIPASVLEFIERNHLYGT
jgi:nicotinate-nucleotide adenylyltransferase